MERIPTPEAADAHVVTEIQGLVDTLRSMLPPKLPSADEGVTLLRAMRKSIYEHLNQLQHEHLLVRAMRHLQHHAAVPEGTSWWWNPRQTGDASEPDLRATYRRRTLLSAEATASEAPKGIIDSRMRDTLDKLATMPGGLHYFVTTEGMARRARTKIGKAGHPIEVHVI